MKSEHLRDMKQFSVSANVRWSGGALRLTFIEFSVAIPEDLLLKVIRSLQNRAALSTAAKASWFGEEVTNSTGAFFPVSSKSSP
jgi:hypothetical protein